jgi:predicted O-methyltransferase YrrM
VKKLLAALLPAADLLLAPLLVPAALLMKAIRRAGVERMPLCRWLLIRIGVFPIRDHYYEPLFDVRRLRRPLSQERELPGIDWNEAEQLALLESFTHGNELAGVPDQAAGMEFHWNNASFCSGDAEYLYQLVRARKPSRVIEVGGGHSTLLLEMAIGRNRAERPGTDFRHVCIEPYEMPWLERTGVEIVRRRVEEAGKALFMELEPGDLLFIDSSHVIRPQGDVLFEILELLPSLKPGVIVHFHDIFSPRDYLQRWLAEEVRFWNEQYLLEAFLSCNRDWKVIGALNYLHHRHYERLKTKCIRLTPDREPGSIYIQKTSRGR